MPRSDTGLTVVPALAESFAEVGSVAVETTAASFVSEPGAPALTLISTPTSAPLAIVPSAHVTVLPMRTQLPCVVVAETKVIPPGSESLRDTLGALAGPLLWTVRLYVSCWPESTGSGASVIVNARSATGSTVVDALAELLTSTGSAVDADTLAWLVIVPPEAGVTVIATLALAPLPRLPSGHVTVPDACEHEPWDGVAELKVTPP